MDFSTYEKKYGVTLQEFIEISSIKTAKGSADKLGIPFKTYARIAKKLGVYNPSKSTKEISLTEILQGLHPNYGTNALKKRLIKAGLKEYKCEICGISDWQNKPIVLQLDHINGNNSDHRLENVRIICPNCHSQTETYAAKKRDSIIIIKDSLPEEQLKIINSKTEVKHVQLIEEINNAGIVFHRFGWVKAVSLIVGIQPQKVTGWMKKNMPDVYQRCYKR